MPFDSPPGQVLSSVPPSSDKRRSSKIGGCAAVVFQIFHGKRLFPRKSLPAERPKHGAINHTDDKLPIAKLLLIADENREVSLKDTAEKYEEGSPENVPKDEPCEQKTAKRTPSVVARLMGLDFMPASEPAFGEKKQLEPQRMDLGCQFSSDMPKERRAPLEKSWKPSARVQPYTSLHVARAKETKTSRPEKFPMQQKASIWKEEARDDVTKPKVSNKSPSLPPHHLDSSFPSIVSSFRKGNSTNGSSTRSRRTAHLLEAATRMLETSTHRNTQTRKQRLQSSMSKSRFGSLDAPKNHKGQSGREQVCGDPRSQVIQQLMTIAVPAPSSRREETKAAKNTSNESIIRRQNAPITSVPDLRRPQAGHVGPEQVLGGGRSTLQLAAPVKRKQGYQQSITQPRANLPEKAKPDWRRQEETSRRLSQPVSCNGKVQRPKSLGTTRPRHPSPPKSFQDSCGGACSSQASNSTLPSSDRMRSSQPTCSRAGSNNTPSTTISSSSVKGIAVQSEDAFDGVEVTQPSQSQYSKTAGLAHGNSSILQAPSISVSAPFGEADNSSYSQDGSISSATYTESHRRSSMESLLSSDPSLSEFTTSSEECSSSHIRADSAGHERVEEKWEGGNSSLDEPNSALDIFLPEDPSHSKLDSLSLDSGDTTSSHTLSDADAGRHDAVHTYSGKNTAAILQELLSALSSSTTSEEAFKKPRAESSESCLSNSDLGHLEKPQILQGDHSLEALDSQDSASCNSDSSENSQSCKPCESVGFLESMECTNVAESQAEEEISLNIEKRDEIDVDNGVFAAHTDFVDCEALMSTLSKLHHINPESIGLNVRARKHHNEEKAIATIGSADGFPGCLVDSALFNKLGEQVQQLDWGLSNSATLSAEDDADSVYRSDMESSFRNGLEEVASQNKKLVTDCINEAFMSFSKQLRGVSSSISGHSSASQVLSKVYKQIDEWRGMAISMNLDDMVEKEMNSTTRRWRNIGAEAEDIAEVVQSTVLSGLMEEVLLELI